MKYAIIIPDGCADEPQEALGDKTPCMPPLPGLENKPVWQLGELHASVGGSR